MSVTGNGVPQKPPAAADRKETLKYYYNAKTEEINETL